MKVIVVYPEFPNFDRHAGANRLYQLLQLFRKRGWDTTLLAYQKHDSRYQTVYESLGIKCLAIDHTTPRTEITEIFKSGSFDCALLVHYYTYSHFAPLIREEIPQCQIILDTVDIHHLRELREAAVLNSEEAFSRGKKTEVAELACLRSADRVWVVTEVERKYVVENVGRSQTSVDVVPTLHEVVADIPDYSERSGFCFVGYYLHPPNLDAFRYTVSDILPEMDKQNLNTPVSFVGPYLRESIVRNGYAHNGVRILGWIPNLHSYLQTQLVGIAPLRFGAGMRGKIGDYLAAGLPCVSTSIGIEGMNLEPGRQVLVADTVESFVDALRKLESDPTLWRRLSSEGHSWIRENLTPAKFMERFPELGI